MKTIDSFDTLLHYVNRLGFAGSGSIQIRQDNLCCVCDAIMASAGAILGPEGKGFPFKVRFHNHVASNGFRYPWLGVFEIKTVDGTRKALNVERLDVHKWIANGRKA